MQSTVWNIRVYSQAGGFVAQWGNVSGAMLQGYLRAMSLADTITSIIATPRRVVPAFGYRVRAEVLDEIFDARELVAVMDAAWARRQARANTHIFDPDSYWRQS